MTTMNLIQMQQALQTMPVQNVMNYADGSDPTVPAYLALTELNRRKQLQESATASQQSPQQTVKQSVESALTSPKQMMGTDLTQAPSGQVNMTQAPQQTDLTKPTVGQVNPTAPVNPAASLSGASPTSQQFKQGGLAVLPINMFKEKNFAHGGIVAFGEGTLDKTVEDAAVQQNNEDGVVVGGPNIQGNSTGTPLPPITSPQQWTSGDANTSEDMAMANPNAGIASINPNIQLSNTPSGTIPTPPAGLQLPSETTPTPSAGLQPPSGTTPTSPMGLQQMIQQAQDKVNSAYSTPAYLQQQSVPSLGESYASQKEAERIAGVSQDPLKATRERYQAMEAKQKESAGGDALDRLIAQASAFATADPTKGFGYAAGVSATASQALKKEQDTIRKQEEMTMAKLYSEFDKEDDARKRGDSKGMLDAQQKIKDHNDKLAELANQNMIAQSGKANALTNATQAAHAAYLAQFEPDKIAVMKDQAMASLMHATAAQAQASKDPEQIAFTKLYSSDPNFARAANDYIAFKTDALNDARNAEKSREEYSKDPILRDKWEGKGGVDAYIKDQMQALKNVKQNTSTPPAPSNLPANPKINEEEYTLIPNKNKYVKTNELNDLNEKDRNYYLNSNGYLNSSD